MTEDGIGRVPSSRELWEETYRTLSEANQTLRQQKAALEQRVGELVEAALHLYDEPPHEIYGIAQIPVENLLRLTAAAKALADGERG